MIRILCIGLSVLFISADSLQAEVVVTYTQSPTSLLSGFQTILVTATSTVPGEPIHVVDFVGDPDNDNPLTARGFFGPLNQSNPLGIPTIFADSFGAIFDGERFRPKDSHFLLHSIRLHAPASHSKESASFLRSIFAGESALGQSIEIAQLVVPNAAVVKFRGSFAIARGGTIVDTPDIVGSLIAVPEPASALPVVLAAFGLSGYRFGRCDARRARAK